MAKIKIRLLVTLVTSVLCLLSSCASERGCIYPGISRKGPLKSIPSINRIITAKHDTVIVFSCTANYTLQGQRIIRCEDGRWTSKIPFCKSIDEHFFHRFMNFLLSSLFKLLVFEQKDILCNNPGDIQNGKKNKNQKFYRKGATVRYWCSAGYSMRQLGASTITCSDNGTWTNQPPECIYCKSALGVEKSGPKIIPDRSMSGSSEKDKHHKAKEGRLNGPKAWCSGRETTPFIEIDFGNTYKITSLATQGSAFDKKWVGWYAVKSSLGRSSFSTYREDDQEKLFAANTDSSSIVKHKLKNAIIARKIRFYPMKSGGFTNDHACMRVETYGCELFQVN